MPYKSKAQAAAVNAKAARGEIPQSVANEMNRASKGKMKHLPEHVHPKHKHPHGPK